MSTTIYYFTATGNSLQAALDIAEGLGGAEVISVSRAGKNVKCDSEVIGFVFPSFAWGMPNMFYDFIKSGNFNKDAYFFTIVICGASMGGSARDVDTLLRGKGAKLSYGKQVKMVSNYDNVNLGCTVENQELADYRLPLFLSYPIKRRFVACAPLLGAIDLSTYLHGIVHVSVGGETGREARVCDYDWVLSLREQCVKADVTFWFKNTGSFFKRDGVIQKINPFKQNSIAKELGINILGDKKWF